MCLFSHKYGKIEEGYQYCTECGIATAVPCKHVWVNDSIYEIKDHYTGSIKRLDVYQQCKNCGDRRLISQ